MEYTTSLKRNNDFRRIYARGKSAVSPYLVLYCRTNGQNSNRFGITVSAKLFNAVKRNRVRRRLREIYRLHESEFRKGVDIIAVSRARAINVPYSKLEEEFLHLAKELKLEK